MHKQQCSIGRTELYYVPRLHLHTWVNYTESKNGGVDLYRQVGIKNISKTVLDERKKNFVYTLLYMSIRNKKKVESIWGRLHCTWCNIYSMC